MPDQFGGIALEDKPAADQFGGVPVEQPTLSAEEAKNVYPQIGPILHAFGHGAKEGWGDTPLGMPREAVEWLSKKGIYGPAEGGFQNPGQAASELIGETLARTVQLVTRSIGAGFGAYQAGVAEMGEQFGQKKLGRDLAAMPEAFFGSPHPLGVPKSFPPGTVFREVPQEARTVPNPAPQAPSFIEAYHGSPYDFERFDSSKIGRGEGAQSYGHGLYFAENPKVAEDYAVKLARVKNYLDDLPPAAEAKYGAELQRLADERDALKEEMDKAQASGAEKPWGPLEQKLEAKHQEMDRLQEKIDKEFGLQGAIYRVRINADHDHFIDFDKPLSGQSDYVKNALAPLINQEVAKLERASRAGVVSPEVRDLLEDWKSGDIEVTRMLTHLEYNKEKQAALLRDAGIAGIKYLDQGSRAAGEGTRNFVVFDDSAVEITHKNGLPVQPSNIEQPGALPPALAEARDLGVIGPPKPDVSSMSPAARAAAEVPPPRVMAAERAPDDVRRGPLPGEPEKAGNIRLDQIGINADAKDVMLDAARKNDDFNQARAGNVPLAQVESLADASGVPSAVLTENDGLGRLMHNDAVVRTWLQAFHQATDEIAEQMRVVANTGDEADIVKLREMKLRFQHMQEQVSGLTAEAGRTLAVFREFYANKGKAEAVGKLLEDNPHLDADSLKKLADAGRGLNDPAAVARFLHDSNKPNFWNKYLYYWVNALISGPVTHLKYIGANAAFGAYEAAVVTPVAGALGAVRRLAGGADGVYVGESAARMWGLIAGTPDALKAAWTAAKNNVMTPFPNEVAAKQVNPLTQVRPSAIGGKLGFAIGIPGRSAAGIHSFFRWLGYRAEIEAQAYRAAAQEGLSPIGQAFWERRATLADQPTEAMVNAGIENGNHLTFIGEQGQFGKAISRLANTRFGESGIQPFKLILPFTHIPGQILRASLEQTPAAFLDSKMRADLLGRNGAVAADTARARLIAGGAVSAMVANWAVNDTITGYGPTDPTERHQWLRTHEPYSVRLGGWWYSYNKFGPIGDLIGLVANLVEVGPKVKEGEYAEAAGHVIKATSRILEDEVGMQGLVNLIEALEDPDRKMARFVSGQAASNLPYSSLIRQSASFSDPYNREAKTFVDQLRYSVPWARQDLLPKRDWLGAPSTNPGYGSIIRQRAVNMDPIDLAVSQLRGFRPAPPQDRIGGVKLPPKMYDEYQSIAGGMARSMLEPIVTAPGWGEIPPGFREMAVHSTVENARRSAGAMMQIRHPELIMQGLIDRQDKIMGVKPTKMTE